MRLVSRVMSGLAVFASSCTWIFINVSISIPVHVFVNSCVIGCTVLYVLSSFMYAGMHVCTSWCIAVFMHCKSKPFGHYSCTKCILDAFLYACCFVFGIPRVVEDASLNECQLSMHAAHVCKIYTAQSVRNDLKVIHRMFSYWSFPISKHLMTGNIVEAPNFNYKLKIRSCLGSRAGICSLFQDVKIQLRCALAYALRRSLSSRSLAIATSRSICFWALMISNLACSNFISCMNCLRTCVICCGACMARQKSTPYIFPQHGKMRSKRLAPCVTVSIQ